MANTNTLETAIDSLSTYFVKGVLQIAMDDLRDFNLRCDLDDGESKRKGKLTDIANLGVSHELMTTKELQKLINYSYTLKDYTTRPNHKNELLEHRTDLDKYFEKILEVAAITCTEVGPESNYGRTVKSYRNRMLDSIQAIKNALVSTEPEPMELDLNDGLRDLDESYFQSAKAVKDSVITKKKIRALEAEFEEFTIQSRFAVYDRFRELHSQRKQIPVSFEYLDPDTGKKSTFSLNPIDDSSVKKTVYDRAYNTINLFDRLLADVPEEFKGNEKNVEYRIDGRLIKREPFLPGILKDMRKQMYMDLVLLGDNYLNPENKAAKGILESISRFEEIYLKNN